MNDIRVLLVDDHHLVRSTLADRLRREPDISEILTASSADEAMVKISEHQPNVILMDIDMPGLISFEAAKQIAAEHPQCHVIFLSAHLQDRYIDEALRVGAKGYLTKREEIDRVLAAIREVAGGGAYFSEEVQARMVLDTSGAKLITSGLTKAAVLRPREREVLRYIAQGMMKRDIATLMHISIKTVEHHTARIMGILGIHDRVELARYAIREKLVEP